jgi:trimeric autotransporter adhesin
MTNTKNLFKKRVITVAVAGVMAGQVMQNANAATTNTVTNNLGAAGVTGNLTGGSPNSRYNNMFTQVNLGDPNGTYSATKNVVTSNTDSTFTIGITGNISNVTNQGGLVESKLGLSLSTVFGIINTSQQSGTTTEYHRVMVKTTTNVNVSDFTTYMNGGSFNATAVGIGQVSGEIAAGAFAVRTSYASTDAPGTSNDNVSNNTTVGLDYVTIDGRNSRFLQSSVVNGVEVTNEASSELDTDGLSVEVSEYDENAGTDTNSEFDQRADAFWLDVNDNVENTQAQLDIETDGVEIEVEDTDGEGMGSYADFGTGGAEIGAWNNNTNEWAEIDVESDSISMMVDTDGTGSAYSEAYMGGDYARFTVTNDQGNTHGLWVDGDSTELSGGSNSTTLTLDDDGAHFDNLLDMNGYVIDEVGEGALVDGGDNAATTNQVYDEQQARIAADNAEASTRLAADGNRDYNAASTNNAAIANDGDSLTTAINGENTRAINAEGNRDYNSGMASDGSSLTTAINTEQSQRVAADVAEASTRLAADNLEATTRANADTALQANIDTETAARRRGDAKLNDRVDDVEGGVAAAIALTSAQQPSAPGKTAVSIGAGFYAGEQAIGINAVHKLANNGNVGVGIAQSTGDGDTAAKVSYGFEF